MAFRPHLDADTRRLHFVADEESGRIRIKSRGGRVTEYRIRPGRDATKCIEIERVERDGGRCGEN